MGLTSRFSVSCILMLSGFACKTAAPESALRTVDFTTEDGSTLVYLIGDDDNDNAGVYRYLCANGRAELPTAEAVRRSCTLMPPLRLAGQDAVPMREFDREITRLYLTSAGDPNGSLNTFELRLKGQLYRCLKADPACDPLAQVAARNAVVAGNYQAQLMGLMHNVFDGDLVRSEPAGAGTGAAGENDAATPEQDGMRLAEEDAVALSAPRAFRLSIFSRQTTVMIPTRLSVPKVNMISFTLSPGCNANIGGISSVTADGVRLVGPRQIEATTGSAFAIRRTEGSLEPMAVSRVEVVIRRTGNGGVCNVTLNGWTAAPPVLEPTDPTPPPAPAKCTPAKRKQLMASFAAKPNLRHWHYLWHGIRNSWDVMSAAEQDQVRTRLGDHWGRTPTNDDVGEEFLHMHRVMIDMVTAHLRQGGCTMYNAWREPPAEQMVQGDDLESELDNPNVGIRTFDQRTPSGGYNQMMQWHQTATSLQALRGVSLGRFGSWLESSLHNNWHMRHADPQLASPAFSSLQLYTLPSDENAEVNRESQDWLGHPYSSHVNPYFWRLHGYVDDRIFTWLEANGYQGLENGPTVADRSRTCSQARGENCYRWRRTWDGLPAQATPSAGRGVAATPHHTVSPAEVAEFRKLPRNMQRLISSNSNMFPGEVEVVADAKQPGGKDDEPTNL